jgi:hypothetical protein
MTIALNTILFQYYFSKKHAIKRGKWSKCEEKQWQWGNTLIGDEHSGAK